MISGVCEGFFARGEVAAGARVVVRRAPAALPFILGDEGAFGWSWRPWVSFFRVRARGEMCRLVMGFSRSLRW
ncbi:MAG: hypothetical protein DI605_06425 [Sphingomonas sp.]|nr:MAG: hypothetical protein DI605_06425 [Sphingomonas sp.]